MLLKVNERGIKVRAIELIGETEADRTELPTLLDYRVEEAGSVGKRSPSLVRLDFLKEVLVHHGCESTIQASFHSFWRLDSDFDSHL